MDSGDAHIHASPVEEPAPAEAVQRAGSDPNSSDEAAAMVYGSLVAVWDRECDRFWARNNLFLLLNAALLGLVGSVAFPAPARAAAAGFGLYFSCCWLLLNRKGRYYTHRWRPVIEAYEAEMKGRPSFHRLPMPFSSVVNEPVSFGESGRWARSWALISGRRPPKRDAGSLITAVVFGFIIAWSALLVVLLVSIVSASGTA